jgi:hypothetical protein
METTEMNTIGPTTESGPKKMNTLAIASIVLAGLSFLSSPAFCLGIPILLSIPGLITGLMGLNQIKKNPGRGGEKVLAMAGAIINGVLLFLWIGLFIMSISLIWFKGR